jgi:EmrB/QacA subfamily drug resistance transporter
MATTSTSPSAAADEASPAGFTHRQILTILSGLVLGMFLAALDQTIVSTSIRVIGDDLHGLSAQAWVTTSFLITSTLTTPIYGKLSDIFGRKPLFLFAITIFVVGSALCGLSTSMYMLAAFRAFQGLGAGGLFSVAIAILADIVSPQERPRYLGYTMSAFASASVLGPVIGGLLSGQSSILGITGWRWIFYVNVPIGIVALIVVNRVLKLPAKPRVATRIDWPGALVLAAGLVPLLLVAEQGRVWGWGSPGSLACYIGGVAGLIAFVWVEQRMGEAALLPIRLFHIQAFRIGSAQSVVIGIGMFGGLSAIPLYLQIVKGASPTKAGLLLLPMVAGLMITSVTVGRLSVRSGHYRKYPIFGCSLMIVAMLLLSTVGADAPLWRTDIYMALFGIGLGTNMQTIQLAMQNSVDARDIGVASSSGTFFRQVGGTLGAAVFLSILFSSAPGKIASAYTAARKTVTFQQAAAAHPDQLKAISGATGSLNDTSFLSTINPVLAHPFLVGFSHSMDLVFIVGAVVFVPALILAIMVKEVPLRRMSGIEAAKLAAAKAQAANAGSATDSQG